MTPELLQWVDDGGLVYEPDEAPTTRPLTAAQAIVAQYLTRHFRVVTWPPVGDLKGPTKPDWPHTAVLQTLDDYHEGDRVGLVNGVELSPGQYYHDVDIDWGAGAAIATAMLPLTDFVYGRASKRISHCGYTLSEALPTMQYRDISPAGAVRGPMLIELRGTNQDGTLGQQSMVPPTIWSKDGKREALEFRTFNAPTFVDAARCQQRVCLAAIGMILAKHLGTNGFGHEARLCWAGFLLRAHISVDDLIIMGEAMSAYCHNREVSDVRTVVESTAAALAAGHKKVKGGPALAKILGAEGKKVIARINEWLGRDSDFLRNKDGVIVKDSQENIRRAIELLDVTLSYNTFAEQILIQEDASSPARYLDDAPLDDLWLRIDRECRFRPTRSFFDTVISSLAREQTFHPVREYLNSLTWDGVPRINTWLMTYADADDADDAAESQTYLEAISSIALMAAVKRVFEPGCKYDEMVVLESPQGLNKSSALRALCPRAAWFSDDLPLNVSSKELIERTLGKWIIESSDLSGKRKTETESLKAMLSRQVDGPARMAYARKPVERPRHFIIIGTTNAPVYLPDSTGARRFWPVKIQQFDVDALSNDRDQLWAEAVVRVTNGESIRLPKALWPAASVEQEKRHEVDPWEDRLAARVEQAIPDSTGRRRIETGDLWDALGVELKNQDRAGALRIAGVMQRLGYENGTMRVEGKKVRAYIERSRNTW